MAPGRAPCARPAGAAASRWRPTLALTAVMLLLASAGAQDGPSPPPPAVVTPAITADDYLALASGVGQMNPFNGTDMGTYGTSSHVLWSNTIALTFLDG